MKLTELQNILGEEIVKISSGDVGDGDIKKAQTIALLAKQVINNADVIIRFDKLKAVQPELRSRIEDLI